MSRTHAAGAIERIRRLLGGLPPALQVAALPWRIGEKGTVEVLLLTSRGTGRWVLPKGWPHKSEGLAGSAAIEAMEESGVIGEVGLNSIGHYHYDKLTQTSHIRRIRVDVFPLKFKNQMLQWPEKGQRELNWTGPDEAAKLVKEPELRNILQMIAESPEILSEKLSK